MRLIQLHAAIREHEVDLTLVNGRVDPAFGFMTLDHDGKIRMDCSSPHAMASLVGLKDQFDIFKGELKDNTGKEVLPADKVADDGFLHGIKFYVEGVEGKIPG